MLLLPPWIATIATSHTTGSLRFWNFQTLLTNVLLNTLCSAETGDANGSRIVALMLVLRRDAYKLQMDVIVIGTV